MAVCKPLTEAVYCSVLQLYHIFLLNSKWQTDRIHSRQYHTQAVYEVS